MRGGELASYLNGRNIPGIRVYPTRLKPAASIFSGTMIEGVRFVITDRDTFNSVRFGAELGSALEKLFPGKMTWEINERLVGNRKVVGLLAAAEDPAAIERSWEAELESFRVRRQQFLLY
jgi:uncharacterized protein YbbC (DUF1343 family)